MPVVDNFKTSRKIRCNLIRGAILNLGKNTAAFNSKADNILEKYFHTKTFCKSEGDKCNLNNHTLYWHLQTRSIYPLTSGFMYYDIKTTLFYATIVQSDCNLLMFMRWAGHIARMGEEKGVYRSCWGNRREGDHWGDLGVNGWIILGWISRRWDVGIWTGLGWPRIEPGGRRL